MLVFLSVVLKRLVICVIVVGGVFSEVKVSGLVVSMLVYYDGCNVMLLSVCSVGWGGKMRLLCMLCRCELVIGMLIVSVRMWKLVVCVCLMSLVFVLWLGYM